MGVIPNIEEVSRQSCVRVVGMRMNRRHFNDDKGRFGETNELNLRLGKDRFPDAVASTGRRPPRL